MTKIVEIATEIAGRQCRDGRDCWECRECRHCQDCRDRQECLLRMPVLPILLAENGWLHAEIEKIDEIAGRDCRDCTGCRPKMPWVAVLLGVKRMRNLETETAKIATEDVGRHCGDYRDCRDCRECRHLQDCRNRRDCRPRLPGLPILPAENGWLHAETKKMRSLPDGIAGTAAQKFREWRGCWEWRECGIWRQRLPRLRRRKSPDIAETTEIAEIAENADICTIAEIAETVAPDAGITDFAVREWVTACWDRKKWRGGQTGITLLQRLAPKNAEMAEVAGSEESAKFADRKCQDCDGECRPTLRRLQR